MAISTFGVTYTSVRAHHFPQMAGNFSTASNPTAATVTEMIAGEAAYLTGKLAAEGLTAATIEAATSSAAYAWCADAVRLGAAVRAIRAMSGQDPKVAEAWAAELKARYKELSAQGGVVFGDAALPDEDPNGPRDWISAHGLDTGEEADISDAVPRFRRDDQL
jgi:hypothetical protein